MYIDQLSVLSVACFEISKYVHVLSSVNVVVYTVCTTTLTEDKTYTVCSHCTLQASLVQIILYLRGLLFIFSYYIFSCMTCMKMIAYDCKIIKIFINVL